MKGSSASSGEEYTRLLDLMEQEAFEQELAELEELLNTTELDAMETAALTATTPLVTATSTNPIIPPIDASNAAFEVTDVRLRQTSSSPSTNTTPSLSNTPITTTGNTNPQAQPRPTASPSLLSPSQAATPPYHIVRCLHQLQAARL